MPIYEYRCQECNEVTEAFVRSGKEPTACPECGEESLKKLISRAGVIFKGSGFYVTDSKSSSTAAPSSDSSSDSSNGAKSSDSKSTDSKSSDSSSKSESSSDTSSKSTASAD
jgi:putative FmdB family regulatory protein